MRGALAGFARNRLSRVLDLVPWCLLVLSSPPDLWAFAFGLSLVKLESSSSNSSHPDKWNRGTGKAEKHGNDHSSTMHRNPEVARLVAENSNETALTHRAAARLTACYKTALLVRFFSGNRLLFKDAYGTTSAIESSATVPAIECN